MSARIGRVVVVVGLLAATVAAFAVAEHVKLERSPIIDPRADRIFSPVCRCPGLASISFRLRRADRLTIGIVDGGGQLRRTLVSNRRFGRGRVDLVWDGRDDRGHVVADGSYRPRVRFVGPGRTIVLENRIRVDTTPPRLQVLGVHPRTFSPDGDHRGDGLAIRYRLSEPGRVLLFVNGRRRVRGRARIKPVAQVEWYGKAEGSPFRAGAYRLALVGQDLAGNRSPAVSAGVAHIRYIELARHVIRARARQPIRVRVSTEAERYSWNLGATRGAAGGPVLKLSWPRRARLQLVVSANGHSDRATVLVGAPKRR